VGGQVIDVTSGRSGVVSVARVHRRLFSPRTPATGTLHVAAACVLILIAAVFSLAGPATAQTPEPQPCRVFTPCTPTVGPWVSNGSGKQAMWTVECTDALAAAVGSDVVFKGLEVPAGIEVSGGLGPGDHQLSFEPILPGSFTPHSRGNPPSAARPPARGSRRSDVRRDFEGPTANASGASACVPTRPPGCGWAAPAANGWCTRALGSASTCAARRRTGF
jgi:hypothetical protein